MDSVFSATNPTRLFVVLMAEFARAEQELELLVSEKERRNGALRQRASEHKCHNGVLRR